MKKVFAKLGFQALVAMFFMLGGLLMTNRAEAQLTHNTQAGTSLNWKSAAEATDIVKQQIESINLEIANYNPGTPAYNNLNLHSIFYKGIARGLSGGESVENAVKNALPIDNDAVGQQTPATIRGLYDEAVVLLTL